MSDVKPTNPALNAGPISPDDVEHVRAGSIPGEVFAAFNELIAEGWAGRTATVRQDEVSDLALAKLKVRLPDMTKAEMFRRGWLDVEGAYRVAGWDVEYDKPGYNETYEATFTFKRHR